MNTRKVKKKVLKPLPKFKTDLEEAIFWDTHSLTDYFDFSRPLNIRFEIAKPAKEETLTFRLQKQLKSQLEKNARRLGLSTASLLRMWTIEKLASL